MKKYLILSAIMVGALALSGCGAKQQAAKEETAKNAAQLRDIVGEIKANPRSTKVKTQDYNAIGAKMMADVKKENALVQGSEQRVIITASGFVAPLVTTKIGNKVIWTNRDRKAVTIIADNGEFSGTINAGASFSHTFETKGMYLYRTTNGDVEGVIMVATR